MYRLDLSDSALFLPEPVYRIRDKKGNDRYALRKEVASQGLWNQILEIPFFAFSPGRSPEGSVPVYLVAQNGENRFILTKPTNRNSKVIPLFYALPGKTLPSNALSGNKSHASPGSFVSPMIVPIYEFKDSRGRYFYSTEERLEGYSRLEQPVCRVWKNPALGLLLDRGVKPVSAF
jgi:hypothetical protein